MRIIFLFFTCCVALFSWFVKADDVATSPTIEVYAKRTGEIPCNRFKGIVKQNCELTTKILLTSYLEYCSTHNCEVDKMEDMIAWLERKEALIAKLNGKVNPKP